MNSYNLTDTICSPVTNIYFNAPVAIIRLDGNKSIKIVKKIFFAHSNHSFIDSPRTAVYGSIKYKKNFIDDSLLIYFKKPNSFTGNDIVEINCHGNKIIIEKILEILICLGCRLALPGEFLWRAVQNNKLSISQAEQINETITQENRFFFSKSNNSKNISNIISSDIYKLIIEIKSLIEVNIDFSDQDIDLEYQKLVKLSKLLQEKLNSYILLAEFQIKLKHGLTCMILGNVNAGKSTLFNFLLNTNRSIVTHIPGTTRDIVSDYFFSNDLKIKLLDTPGIRKTKNIIENIGILNTINEINNVDFAIFIVDISNRNSEIENNIFKLLVENNIKYIFLINKIDTLTNIDNIKSSLFIENSFSSYFSHPLCIANISISLKSNLNTNLIVNNIDSFTNNLLIDNPFVYLNNYKLSCLKEISHFSNDLYSSILENQPYEILAEQINIVINQFNIFNNKNLSEEVLSNIFSQFCIGK